MHAHLLKHRLFYIYCIGIDCSPSNITVLLNEYAVFHCSSLGGFIVWQINDRPIREAPSEYNVTFLSIPRSDGNHGENATLQILGVNSANNTNITCIVRDIATALVRDRSAVVYLTVQGEL